ncbi:RagB/SusD family nutrient uptake outer membrane protein [Parapedobacter deserti]|uniref:RagB/SusD family nutrient uptake outer membrane protein n=1 Tax=Parapedobacter deserti TaxID=1912957 RepID=A0ABV7JXF3_9SPHI
MKPHIICLLVLLAILQGCDAKLDVAPRGYLTSGTFYKTETDAKAAVIGAYAVLHELYWAEHILTPNEICADNGIPFLTGGADRIAIWRYTHNAANIYPGQIWQASYKAIQHSNVIIDRVPGISMDEQLKRVYIAEAKYLRALHYFNLVRFFGELPLVLSETTNLEEVEVPRSSIADVYQLIESDLTEAEATLPLLHETEKGRATKGAAMALLAKVYLTRAGNTPSSPYWAQAASKAKEVIDLKIYDLWEDYADVFTLANRGGKESIFEVQFLTDIKGNHFTTGYAPRGAPIVPNNGFGIFRVTKSLFDSYTADDKRKAVSFLTSYVHPGTGQTVHLSVDDPDPTVAVSFWKLADPTVRVGLNGGTSWPYMRYAEVLLIYAEALNEANNGPTPAAYEAINEVRDRAGLTALSDLDKAAFNEAVLLERRLELCFEGHRWFDLVRRDQLIEAVTNENSFGRNAPIKEIHKRFPIPFREMEANKKLEQNSGY